MKQQTFAMAADAQSSFEQHRKPTRRDEFLKTMEELVPWSALCEEIAPHYPKAGNGRLPIGLERMLRIHFIQHWFNLADLACEEALYDSASLRRFVGIDLGAEPVPEPRYATVVCRRTPRGHLRHWRWPISISVEADCWGRCARKGRMRVERPAKQPGWAGLRA